MNQIPYPILFSHVYKDYIWGGRRIAEVFGRDDAPEVCAESWEISDRTEGMSVVANGPLKGRSLHDLTRDWGPRLVGADGSDASRFPLLIKIIDASRRLSVQVHPDEHSAAVSGGEPKTECWTLLPGSAPDAYVFAGFREPMRPDDLKQKLAEESLEGSLRRLPVKPGDVVFVPGGRVHAIGEGCILLEVQQNSNTTYRLYDWGRVGHDGKPRALHVRESIEVLDWDDTGAEPTPPLLLQEGEGRAVWSLVSCPFFHLRRIELSSPAAFAQDPSSFTILFAARGAIRIGVGEHVERIPPGTSCLIPACAEEYRMEAESKTARVIAIRTGPDPERKR